MLSFGVIMNNRLFSDLEISGRRLRANIDQILIIFDNLSKHWYFDGLEFTTQLMQEKNKYVLFGQSKINELNNENKNPNSSSQSPNFYNSKLAESHCFGYLELNQVDRIDKEPIEVRLVCSWPPVLSFWQELDKIFQKEFEEIHPQFHSKNQNNIILQWKPAGRPTEKSYDKAYEEIKSGKFTYEEAFKNYLNNNNFSKVDKNLRDAFKAAMKRRQNNS